MAQGRHLHGLLLRGAQSLDELFPGFLDELVADGAPCFDGSDLSRLYFCMNGRWSSPLLTSDELILMPSLHAGLVTRKRLRENTVRTPNYGQKTLARNTFGAQHNNENGVLNLT